MSQLKAPYAKFQAVYKNRIKVHLPFPRIQPSHDDDVFNDVVKISDDGNLSTGPSKISPHFDANTISLYAKANEDVSKCLQNIKSRDQCEQLRALLALDIRYLNGCDYKWAKPDGTAMSSPPPANVPALGLIASGQGVDDDLSEGDEATSGNRLRVAKDPHDFLGFWDPGNLDAIPWSDLSYDDDSNFTAKRSYHAAAIFVFYADALREKHPDFCNRVHAGWQAHFKRPIRAEDLDRMPTVGDNAYTDDEVVWCNETIRYLRGQLDDMGLTDRGLPVGESRRTSRRATTAAVAAAAVAAATAATAATPPPRGRERRVERRADETSSDSDLESSNAKGSGRSRARTRQGRSGGDGPVPKIRYGLHFRHICFQILHI